MLWPSKFIRWKKLKSFQKYEQSTIPCNAHDLRLTSPGQMLNGDDPMKTDALTNPTVKAPSKHCRTVT